MQWAGKFKEQFLDDEGAFSQGRLIAFIGTLLAIELVEAGLFVVMWSLFRPSTIAATALGTGMGIIGIGSGFFTGGALLKFGQKVQEAQMGPRPSLPPGPNGSIQGAP